MLNVESLDFIEQASKFLSTTFLIALLYCYTFLTKNGALSSIHKGAIKMIIVSLIRLYHRAQGLISK